MCGIAGVACRGHRIADPAAVDDAFAGALAHRGPDGRGSWLSVDAAVLLVHRRLAIIDPTPAGAQPMTSPDGRHRLVFNGEVYNHVELRRDLESHGERFLTRSDTEVLLRLLAREGPSGLARVRGMFALACWDALEESLLLARDRFGIKPLYVAASPRRLAFASEIGALDRAGLTGRTPSAAGVLAFLSWGSVPPPLTWAEGVEALEPGTWWSWRRDGRELRGTFADVRRLFLSSARRPQSDDDFRAATGEAVRDAVRAHLVADVPVGVFLSGGVDSGALVSAAVAAGASGLRTFTVGFDDPASESAPARSVAKAFGVAHTALEVDASGVARDFDEMIDHLDQPSIDGVNSFYVARAVAATGIKAVLSGTGGDELFGGYPSFVRLPRAVGLRRMTGPFWPLVRRAGDVVAPARLRPRWNEFAAGPGGLVDAYRAQRGFMPRGTIDALAGPALRDRWSQAADALAWTESERLAPAGAEGPLASVARLESRLYLSSQLLRDIDVMAMAHGLEVRVPFVDHDLAARVWPELGLHARLVRRKRLLWESLRHPLPREIVSGPKRGFSLPFGRWLGAELAPLVRDGMRALAVTGWVAADAPDRVWSEWQSRTVHWSRPWGLAVLGHLLLSRERRGGC
jgi:asparagine synthase (glutamine-hydrolysing)